MQHLLTACVVLALANLCQGRTVEGRTNHEKPHAHVHTHAHAHPAKPPSFADSVLSSSLGQTIVANLPKYVVQTLQGTSGEPSQCVTAAGEEGVCLMSKACQKQGGLGVGRCSDRVSVCCLKTDADNIVTCGAEVRQDDVVFRNADYPSNQALFGQCKVTVNAKVDVCQLRLDFQEFVLSPSETCGPRAGLCVDDAFSVSAGVESASYPVLCGQNSGQHMYVDMSQSRQAILSVRLNTKSDLDRRWSIRITQISCWSPGLAPEGCLQYHTKASDVITSFNFARNPIGFHYFAGLHYTICIRRQLGFCSIIYRENGVNGFRLSPVVNQQCKDAYLLIPTGSSGSIANGNIGDRFCGTRLAGNSVASDLAPFRVSFVTSSRIGIAECPCRPATVILPPGRPVVIVPEVVERPPKTQNTVVVGNALGSRPPVVFQPVPPQVIEAVPVAPVPVVPIVQAAPVAPAPVVFQAAPVAPAPVVFQAAPVAPVAVAPVVQAAPLAPVVQAAPLAPVVQAAPLAPVVQAAPLAPVVQAAPLAPVVQAAPLAPVVQAAPLAPVVQAAPLAPVSAVPAVAPAVAVAPAGLAVAQLPVAVDATQPQFREGFRQILDEQNVCRAGGFSLRYSQIPCGC